jgi:histo-blood group ABO system transferase
MAKVGLLVIATNKYARFVDDLWQSAKRYFLAGHEVTNFVFTDQPDLAVEASQVIVPHAHLPWPGATLFRYRAFAGQRARLAALDYLFYCDADMRFVDTVGDEILGDLVGTIHPGFFNKARSKFTYETRTASRACVGPREGDAYFAGGFNGGRAEVFLAMADTLADRIDDDYRRGVVAVWHDESHLNRYFIDHPPAVRLSPSYCYPEDKSLPFPPRLLALNKNHKAMRA